MNTLRVKCKGNDCQVGIVHLCRVPRMHVIACGVSRKRMYTCKHDPRICVQNGSAQRTLSLGNRHGGRPASKPSRWLVVK